MQKTIFLILILIHFSSCNKSSTKKVLPPDIKPILKVEKGRDITNEEVLKRTKIENMVYVKQILLFYDQFSPRFKTTKRSEAETIDLTKKLLSKLKSHPEKFDSLVKKYSDDPITGQQADYIIIENDGVPSQSKSFSLRLKENEISVLHTKNTYRIIKRIAKPKQVSPPDTVEILKRKPKQPRVGFQTINIAWRQLLSQYEGNLSPEVSKRSQVEAKKLVFKIYGELKQGKNWKFYEERYSSKIPKPKTIPKHNLIGHSHSHKSKKSKNLDVLPIQKLAIRLNINEIGIVSSKYGYHIVKRVK